jgi:CheY-like chemotaxis protein
MKFHAQRVLVAGTPEGVSLVAGIFGEQLEVVAAHSVDEALQKLKQAERLQCVVCNLRLDDSRMFDFLDALRASASDPRPRVVYLHASPPPLSAPAKRAMEAALEALGVHALIDFPALAAHLGEEAARGLLRKTILAAR